MRSSYSLMSSPISIAFTKSSRVGRFHSFSCVPSYVTSCISYSARDATSDASPTRVSPSSVDRSATCEPYMLPSIRSATRSTCCLLNRSGELRIIRIRSRKLRIIGSSASPRLMSSSTCSTLSSSSLSGTDGKSSNGLYAQFSKLISRLLGQPCGPPSKSAVPAPRIRATNEIVRFASSI